MSGRLFKSCRRCRQQKVRCDARTRMPCSRCRAAGYEHECVLDTINRPRPAERRRHANTARQRSSFDTGLGVSPTSNISVPSNHLENIELQQFSPQDMIAPQSVMHSMSVNMREDSPIFLGDSDVSDPKGDIISRGIISEEDARCIYERFMNCSKNFIPLFDPVRDTFDSIRSRSLFCFTVIIYLASRAASDFRADTHLQRVLQDEAQRLAEDSFFAKPTKLETVQGMILLAAYSEKTWFSTALILRTALDLGLEKSLDTLLAQSSPPRSYLSARMEDRQLVWQTRTWLISSTLELDVASGTGRKSRLGDVDILKLRKFLDYPLSLHSDMRTVSIIEYHQIRTRGRQIIENSAAAPIIYTELPAIMRKLQQWWEEWDELHHQNAFHPGAFQRSSLKLMLNYAKVFTYCAAIARIQKLQQTPEGDQGISSDAVLGLWKSLVEVIESQLTLLVTESAYRCQLVWAPTYPALTIAFITTFAIRVARWHPTLINRRLVLQRVRQILEYLKQPPYPDIHRTVQIFVNYAGALLAEQDLCNDHGQAGAAQPSRTPEVNSTPRSEFITSIPEQAAENPMIRMEKYTDLTAPLPSESRPEPVLPRLLGFDIPNWNLTAPIADSFDLFEEGQTDIFDFLPDLCRT
ncbi:Zn(II)2Cys6 transcription factor [Aspergillus foveolatus]|uniref:Zn(II)2Cys6 transcription factor n=1 Tax=Aspergillus foveolatus TaxID=210207 RepID=UPI003CCE35D5